MLKMLFTPIRIGKMELKNRIVMPAMHFLPSWDGALLPHHTDYFVERAKGGAALIIIGGCTIDDLSGPVNMISVKDDKFIPGIAALAQAVQANGARIAAQLYQAGRYSHSVLMGGRQSISSSPVRSKFTGETPRALTVPEIKQIQINFALAAGRLQRAGFDAVEVIASAGYLISQFLSPVVNRREDEYGGSFENRMRFGLEVAREVRRAVGPDFPIIFRVAGNEFMEGGLENKDAQLFCRELEKAGVDMINVTGGWHETRVPQLTMALPRGGYVYLAAGIKQAVSIPVMACNRINDPMLADRILRDGLADLIGFARGLIADPELPNKARDGRFEEINRCIGCNQGCFDTLFAGQPQTCLVNARAGDEARRSVSPAPRRKKVMVIGGGPAGMEAARVAALRGHKVVLYEKGKNLGGQLHLAAIPPGRGEFLIFGDYLETQLKKLNVAIHLGVEVSAVQVETEKPDVLVLATGAGALIPPIKGVDGPNVRLAWDVLRGKVDTGKEVIVIGGGAVGLETALFLAHKGALDAEILYFLMFKQAEKFETLQSLLYRGVKKITVLEMLKKLGRDIGTSTRWTILQDVSRMGIKTFTRTRAKEITPEGVIAERDGKNVLLRGDTVVIAAGARSENSLYEELKGRIAEVYLIGDAKSPRKVLEAVAEGFEAGRAI
ncbi:MAG: NADH:flavin oxidoreductase/NADH oxidase [Deltaproteobacteria bacterium]|nr:NADH:flavin oxidoreductase/NADH oxidase [Deltaproteobacteria bacterium]